MKLKVIIALLALTIAAQSQTFKTLYKFNGGRNARNPMTDVIVDSQGVLYGSAEGGALTGGQGTLYSFDVKESVIHRFKGKDGSSPSSPLLSDGAGGWFGTTQQGGGKRFGAIYHLSNGGIVTVLHAFDGQNGTGGSPAGSLALDSLGNLYGVTTQRGDFVWRLDTQGNFSQFSDFVPAPGLLIDEARGFLYGGGWNNGSGFIYKLDLQGNKTVLYNFRGGLDGSDPIGALVQDASGNLYGVTSRGGDPVCQCGTIFKVDQKGQETVLHRFKGGPDGALPPDGLVMDATGNLYGTTASGGPGEGIYGTVFKYDMSTRHHSILHAFKGKSDGACPRSGLAIDSQGSLYGTTAYGGNLNKCSGNGCGLGGCGVLFKITP
jgi:uncharacterized repeat protein (TIGR03803 family)